MDQAIHKLLLETRSPESATNENYTHMTLHDRKQWLIDAAKLQQFWAGYCSVVQDSRNISTLAERINKSHKLPPPIISNIVLKFEKQEYERFIQGEDNLIYDELFIMELVRAHQLAMLDLLNIHDENGLTCVYLKSEYPFYDKDYFYSEIRLQFPYCKVDANYQFNGLRPRVIHYLRRNKVVSRFHLQPIGDWDDLFDPFFLKEAIPLYLSTKNEKRTKVMFERIYAKIETQHIENEELPMLLLSKVFAPGNHQDCVTSFNPQFFNLPENADHDFDFWLPMFLSIYYWDKITTQKTIQPVIHDRNRVDTPSTSAYIYHESRDLDIAEKMISMLLRNGRRLSDETFWKDIGRALYSADNGGYKGLNMWVNFTENGAYHTAEECEDTYESFEGNNLTVKTLMYYARQDAPDDYTTWHRDWCDKTNASALTCTTEDVSRALYREFMLDYVCASVDKGLWFQFRDPRWVRIEKGIFLHNDLAGKFCNRFERTRAKISNEIATSNDNSEKKAKEGMLVEYNKLINKLKNENFQTTVMKAAVRKFYIEGFLSMLNSNENLMATKNYIIETLEDRAIYRPGKPEDYVSLCTGKPYPAHYTWETPVVKDVMKWYGQMFPVPELCHEVWKYQASTLRARNSIKKIAICTGRGGDNGKSMFKKGNEAALGEYAIPGPSFMLTGKGAQSTGPNPELARAAGRRQLWFSEPDEEQPFSGSQIKSLSGGDKVFCRMLHSDGGDMELYFHMILHCNDIPDLTSGGPPAIRRLLIFPFLSQWVMDPPASEEEQYRQRKFQMNDRFEDNFKFKGWGPAILWIMVQYYEIFIRERLRTPKIVQEVTAKYREQNDHYSMFIRESLEFSTMSDGLGSLHGGAPDTMKIMTTHDLYKEFKLWYQETFSDKKVPDKIRFLREMSDKTRLGEPDGVIWRGIQMRVKGIANNPYSQRNGQSRSGPWRDDRPEDHRRGGTDQPRMNNNGEMPQPMVGGPMTGGPLSSTSGSMIGQSTSQMTLADSPMSTVANVPMGPRQGTVISTSIVTK